MTEVTTLQAAGAAGVQVATIHQWIHRGKLRPVGKRSAGRAGMVYVYDLDDVMAAARPLPGGAPRKPIQPEKPKLVLCDPAPPLPGGLARLAERGLFTPLDEPEVGGGRVIGLVRIGGEWLKVHRAENGVIYHDQTEWMEWDVDWQDNPIYAETVEELHAA